jgi:glycosyltransferase involved in cell wall biosynthesis
MGAGKAIISTPYWYAAELLDEGRGVLVPFENPDAIATAAIELLDNDSARQDMRKRAYSYGRQMVWNRVAQSYMRSFERARIRQTQPAYLRLSVQSVESNSANLLLSA